MRMRAYCCFAISSLVFATQATGEVAVQPGDIAYGLSTNNKDTTAEQIREGAKAGSWSQFAFLQSMEFDNANGIWHNGSGNLLCLNFGTSGAGGSLYNLSTNGSNAAQEVFKLDGVNFGLTKTRVSGLSVSPDNKYVAVFAYDLPGVVVLEYDAGAAIGTGAGVSITNGWQTTLGTTGTTQGTTWYDNDTIILYVLEGTATKLYTIDFSGGTFGTAEQRAEIAPIGGTGSGGRFAEVEYNPNVAPFVFASYAHFSNSATNNTLTIVDPSDWSQVKQLNNSTSMNTAREAGLSPDLRLYFSQSATAAGPHLEVLKLDVVEPYDQITLADIEALTDNSTENYYTGTISSNFSGMDVAFGVAAVTGACCLEESCANLSAEECAAQGGEYKGDGTDCETPEICAPPTGACCVPLAECQVTTEAACLDAGGEYKGDLTTCGADTCPVSPQPVEPGDLALGLSNANQDITADHIRNGVRIGLWSALAFSQSMEFDNANGFLHNARGNLLSTNFGATAGSGLPPDCTLPEETDQGGKIYNLATDGSNAGEILYEFDTRKGGLACTRVSGLGVSTDNTLTSVLGYDTGNLYVLKYDAGSTVGTGLGAAISAAYEWSGDGRDTFTVPGASQGTTWYNESTVLAHALDLNGGPGISKLWSVEFDATTNSFTETERTTIFNIGAGSRFTDVEYNPELAPFIFCFYSSFETGITNNTLSVIDPADWTVIRYVDYSGLDGNGVKFMETGREIALGGDLRLYVGQFSALVDTINLDPNGDGEITLSDIEALQDNDCQDYYASGTFAAFSGLDVALEGGLDPCSGVVCGDSNGDGEVNFNDIDCFVAALIGQSNWEACGTTLPPSAYVCANDTSKDGSVDFNDIDPFVTAIIDGSCP